MGNMQICKTVLGYIKRRKKFNDEKQPWSSNEMFESNKAESENLYHKNIASVSPRAATEV